MADIPAPLTYGTIVGRFISVGADTSDPGEAPDIINLSGTVTIAPNLRVARIAGTTTNYLAVRSEIVAPVVNGVLQGPGGVPSLRVLASNSPGISPSPMEYTATFQLTGVSSQPSPVTFLVPSGDTVDLATIVSLPTPPPVQTVVVDAETLVKKTDIPNLVVLSEAEWEVVQENADSETLYFTVP